MRSLEIAIIGAGIAGLGAAAALLQRGLRARVYEQAPALGDVGAGLTVSPNATHALHAIGLERELAAIGMRPAQGGVKHWRTGELLVSVVRGASMQAQYGAPYYQVHRADLHAALVRCVRASATDGMDPIVLDHRFVGVRVAGGKVEVAFANGARITADVLIGADGARSAVRTEVFGASQPRFTGYVAYRGLAEMARLGNGVVEPPSCLSLGPGASFTRYLVRNGTLVNYVGLAERDDWREEGWSIRASMDELLAEYEGWYADIERIIRATPPDKIFKWALLDRDPLPTWVCGPVTLLGDAAHPMLPFLGQGAAMGLEDAIVLARAIAAADSIDAALRRYEAARLERTTFVMLKSRETAKIYHSGDLDSYHVGRHPSAESLGLMAYNPAVVPV
ncbi:MAG: FAD-dependent monooxygenase [Gammaproteobacteria bacterium]|nr:FAD-dependent monooxygenase [Gammaproteobacteria bacterium]